jgi:hypothetical protein
MNNNIFDIDVRGDPHSNEGEGSTSNAFEKKKSKTTKKKNGKMIGSNALDNSVMH